MVSPPVVIAIVTIVIVATMLLLIITYNPLPAGIKNGDVIRNAGTTAIAFVENNKTRAYTTMEIYQSYGSPEFKDVSVNDFALIPVGEPMPLKV